MRALQAREHSQWGDLPRGFSPIFLDTDGTSFPVRSQLIGVAFGVIRFTLVGQRLNLLPLIRALGIQSDDQAEQEPGLARRALTLAALARREELAVSDAMRDMPQAVLADQRAHLSSSGTVSASRLMAAAAPAPMMPIAPTVIARLMPGMLHADCAGN